MLSHSVLRDAQNRHYSPIGFPLRLASAAVVSVLAAALFVAAGILAPTGGAQTVLGVGGTSGSLGSALKAAVSTFFSPGDVLLGGIYGQGQVTPIDYPASIWPVTGILDPSMGRSVSIGVSELEAAVKGATDSVVVIGISQGSLVTQQVEENLNSDLSVPSSTTFYQFVNPNYGLFAGAYGSFIPILNYVPRAMTPTRFNTIVVVDQYDGFSDPIARPWNLLTDANALMAIVFVHPFAQNADLSAVPAANITAVTNSQGGTTTTYVVPTPDLPLTRPLRLIGVPTGIVNSLDNALRPIIDRGYEPLGPIKKSTVSTNPAVSESRVPVRSSARRSSPTPPAAPAAALKNRGRR